MTVWPNGSKTIPTVTSEYGPRTPIDTNGDGRPDTGNFHFGIDLRGWANNKSPFAGKVIFAAYNGAAGNEIRIQAPNGDVVRIKHNARFLVSVGQQVAEGQDVGVMGTTGASTGVHCHFECWVKGTTHINPRVYMAAAISGAGNSGGGLQSINEEVPMFKIFRQPGGDGQYVQSLITGRYVGIANPYHLGLLTRALRAVSLISEEMYTAEADIVAGYFAQINPPAGLDVAALAKALDAANDDDTSSILAAVGKISVAAGATPAQIAAEVDKVLAGDFAALPKSVLDKMRADLAP